MRVAARTGEVAAFHGLLARRGLQDQVALGEVVRGVVEGARGFEVRAGGSFLRFAPEGEQVRILAGEAPAPGFVVLGGPRTGVMSDQAMVVIPLGRPDAATTAWLDRGDLALREAAEPAEFPVQEELCVSRAGAQAWLETHGHVGPRVAVRRRPAIYLGDARDRRPGRGGQRQALDHLLERVAAERRAGQCTRLDVTLHDEDHVTITDDGAGSRLALLPGETPGDDRPIPATWDWSSDHPDQNPLNTVRAVSERFETDAVVGPRRLVVVHERGRCVSRSQEPAGDRRGTRLDVRLDRTILTAGFDCAWARRRLDEVAHLLPGLRVTFTDLRRPDLSFDAVRSGGLVELLEELGVHGVLGAPIAGRCESSAGRWEAKVVLQLARAVTDLGPARAALAARVAEVADHLWTEPESPGARDGLRVAFANDHPVSPRGAIERGLEAGLAAREGWGGRGLPARLAIAVAVRGPVQFGGSTRWVVDSPEVEPLVRDALIEAIETATRERPEEVARALRPQTGS